MTTENIPAQASDEPPCPFCNGAPRYLRKLEGIYVEALICDACNFGLAPEKWRNRAAPVIPAAGAVDEPDMLWLHDDYEVFANDPKEFAEDFASNWSTGGRDVLVKVDCAYRGHCRTMKILTTNDGDDRKVSWEWVDAAISAQQGPEGKQ